MRARARGMRSAASRFAWRAITAAFAVAILAGPALAATNPEEAAGTTAGWIYRWINFGILIAVLVWVFTKKTPAYFRGRQKAIAEAIAESARAREEAQRQGREAQAKMASLEHEIAELRARAKRESAAEIERIHALAQEDAKRIEHAAAVEVHGTERIVQMELKAMAARMAVERAEALLGQQMTPQADADLFRGFVSELAGSAN